MDILDKIVNHKSMPLVEMGLGVLSYVPYKPIAIGARAPNMGIDILQAKSAYDKGDVFNTVYNTL
jgi:hypothetical protein